MITVTLYCYEPVDRESGPGIGMTLSKKKLLKSFAKIETSL